MFAAGLAVLLLAAVFQGSYGLGMKKYEPFSWEAMWAVFSIAGMVITPCVWAAIEVPNFFQYIAATPLDVIVPAAACGLFWGVTAIVFGLAIDYIGMSLTNGIAYGVSCIVGALFPLVTGGSIPSTEYLIGLAVGVVLLVVGLVFYTKAGIMRDAESSTGESGKNPKFMTGLIFAFIGGLGGAAQNVGFSIAGVTSQLAIDAGVSATAASILPWIVVISIGGFIANFGYALILLIKNHNFGNYTAKGCGIGYLKSILTGVAWYAALGVYGKASVMLGDYGAVVGWIGFNAGALIIANAWGIKDGEWAGHDAPRKKLLIGLAVIVVSLVVLGFANNLA